jgi:hypothetical protein
MPQEKAKNAILTILFGLFLVSSLKLVSLIPSASRPTLLEAVTFAAALISPFVVLWGAAQLIAITTQSTQPQKKAIRVFGQLTGSFLLIIFLCVFHNLSPEPQFLVEALPAEQWGFGGLAPGMKYYVRPNMTCVIAYGDSHRLGLVRVVTNIKYLSGLSIPSPKLPPSGN